MSLHVIEDNITTTRLSLARSQALNIDTRDLAGCYWHTQLTLANGVSFSDIVGRLDIGQEYTVGNVTNLVFADFYPVSNTLTFISNKRYGAKTDDDRYTTFANTNTDARITDITSNVAEITTVSAHFGTLYANAVPRDYNSISVTDLVVMNGDNAGFIALAYNIPPGVANSVISIAPSTGTHDLFTGNQPRAITTPIYSSNIDTAGTGARGTHTAGHVEIRIPNVGSSGMVNIELKKNDGFGTINIDRQHSRRGL